MAQPKQLRLAHRLYLMLVLPFLAVSLVVTAVTFRSLDTNATELTQALKIQARANRVLELLLIQDDATKAILLDPNRLADFSDQKIAAYDEHKKLLAELQAQVPDAAMQAIIHQLADIDTNQLRPIDTDILERLFTAPDDARREYFEKYEPARQQYETAIRRLSKDADEHARPASATEQQLNLRSLVIISLALALGILIVTGAIHVLAGQVERSDANTRTLLGILREGLFFFDRTGRIAPERSQAMETILPESARIDSLHDFVRAHAGGKREDVDACLKLLWADANDGFFSDFDSTVTMLPRRLTQRIDGERVVTVEYRPLRNAGGDLEKVVAVVADVTEQVKNEQEAARQAERVRKISMIVTNVAAYREFAAEAQRLFDEAAQRLSEPAAGAAGLVELKRHLHTLKGSVGTFEFQDLAERIHGLEDALAEDGPASPRVQAQFDAVMAQWREERTDLDAVLNLDDGSARVTVDQEKIHRLEDFATRVGQPALTELVLDLTRVPLARALGKYDSYLRKLATRRGDKRVALVCDEMSDGVTPAELQPLDGALVHLLRNGFDHGIEDVADRMARGKPETGTIRVLLRRRSDLLELTIADDGAGIDAARLAEKAVARGLWTREQAERASPEERLALIYAAGLSTKDEVTDVSGRGVGMDAVKAQIEALGGTIRVHSEPGHGTRFVLTARIGAARAVPAVRAA